mgnify:CR=1 FL=1
MPDVLTKVDIQELSEEEWSAVRKAIEEALQHLTDFRKQEGLALEKKFTEKIDNIEHLLKSIEPFEKERVAKIRERITEALEKTLNTDYDKNRLEQELIYYIEKLDINEEKQRLSNHLNYFRETMANGHGQGKKLGFIAQEMGREINTTGSKSKPCTDAEHRGTDERRAGTDQRTSVKRNVTPHIPNQYGKTYHILSTFGFWQINHYQLPAHAASEPGFLHLCHQPSSTGNGTERSRILLPEPGRIQAADCQR